MKLTVLERLMAMGSLPAEGNIVTMRLRQTLIGKLGFAPEEFEKYGIKTDADGMTVWNPDVPQEKEVDLKIAEINVIRDNLEKLDKETKLTPNHLSLYDKFMEEEVKEHLKNMGNETYIEVMLGES